MDNSVLSPKFHLLFFSKKETRDKHILSLTKCHYLISLSFFENVEYEWSLTNSK